MNSIRQSPKASIPEKIIQWNSIYLYYDCVLNSCFTVSSGILPFGPRCSQLAFYYMLVHHPCYCCQLFNHSISPQTTPVEGELTA